jgi:hypothetical protein
MKNMTETEMIEADFEKIVVTAKESGNNNDYYYYKVELSKNVIFTSDDNEEVSGGCYHLHDNENQITITDISDVFALKDLFSKWEMQEKKRSKRKLVN